MNRFETKFDKLSDFACMLAESKELYTEFHNMRLAVVEKFQKLGRRDVKLDICTTSILCFF